MTGTAAAAIATLLMLVTGCASAPPAYTRSQLDTMSDEDLRTTFLDRWDAREFADETAIGCRNRILERHPEWPQEIRDGIAASQVINGMDSQQVTWAWGRPLKDTRDSSPYGDVVRWSFTSPALRHQRTVTFVNGRVAWWSDARN